MRDFLQYIYDEVKDKRLDKKEAIDFIRQFQTGIGTANHSFLHPLLHQNISDLSEQRYSSTFTGKEFFFADHIVNGQKILPAVAYLEMARAAIEEATGSPVRDPRVIKIKNVVWVQPIEVDEEPVQIHIGLYPEKEAAIAFEIYGPAKNGETGETSARTVYSQGNATLSEITENQGLDLKALQADCNGRKLSGTEVYNMYKSIGLDYGPGHQGIETIYIGKGLVLAKLSLPSSVAGTEEEFVLHPSIMDGALQASICMIMAEEHDGTVTPKLLLPFALEELEVYCAHTRCAQARRCTGSMWAVIRYSRDNTTTDKVRKLDIDICDEQGNVCVRLKGFTSRMLEYGIGENGLAAGAGSLMFEPVWKEQAGLSSDGQIELPEFIQQLVILCEPGSREDAQISPESIETGLKRARGVKVLCLQSKQKNIAKRYQTYAVQVFEALQKILTDKPTGKVLIQLVVANHAEQQVFTGLSGILKTAQLENPKVIGQIIEVETLEEPEGLIAILKENARRPMDSQVRYQGGKRQVAGWSEVTVSPEAVEIPWKDGGVYLITGGAGGLGMIFAKEIVGRVKRATLVLTGRSMPGEAKHLELKKLESPGTRVEYRPVDVSDGKAVNELLRSIKTEFGKLDGIIHCAGVIRDNYIIKKTKEELLEVLAPKVNGLVNLDEASRDLNLDFMILFSSTAGSLGNPGQADYAAANAFMDAYAGYRNVLVSSGQRLGRTLSINWPLWQEGGMRVDETVEKRMQQSAGMVALRTGTGIRALYDGIASRRTQVGVLEGDSARALRQIRAMFLKRNALKQPAPAQSANSGADRMEQESGTVQDQELIREKVSNYLKKLLSPVIKLSVERIEVDTPMEKYGIDSIMVMELTNQLEKTFGSLSKTLFFEYHTIQELSGYFLGSYREQLNQLLGIVKELPTSVAPASLDVVIKSGLTESILEDRHSRFIMDARKIFPEKDQKTVDVAIIGITGRYPGARNIQEFWHNLINGKDCITEIPKERWDNTLYFSEDKYQPGKTYCKWGGFIDEVDRFDPQFFNISPREAAFIDPQERLFLETVWNLFESQGITRETLEQSYQSMVGVFVGAMYQQYHAFDSDLINESLVSLTGFSSIANRVSYFFNLQGPSIAVDTMCSSAVIAIHTACESLMKGECRLAIAGGVNLSIHPKKYLGLSQVKILGSHPDSRSFGDGDGYLPAEGVGAVLLKPLSKAIQDGDSILAVIKSVATNHGGHTNGYQVPNPNAQAQLIEDNFRRSGIDPRTISYVESAANGSNLGDPIEVTALTKAFQKFTQEKYFCAIGSVKSNIGHAEAASGISQLIKVVLQLQHQTLAPSIKAEPLNPNLSFENTPFYLQREVQEWKRPMVKINGREVEVPRRATVSSFGAAGSNAHMIIEEYIPTHIERTVTQGRRAPQLVVFSARNHDRLQAVIRQMLEFFKDQAKISLPDLAHTLQVGREAMEFRLAMVVGDRKELIQGLETLLESKWGDNLETPIPIFFGNPEIGLSGINDLLSGKLRETVLEMLLEEKNLEKIAHYWVNGGNIPWGSIHQGEKLSIIPLPTYPFARERYWLPESYLIASNVYNDNTPKSQNPVAEKIELSLRAGIPTLEELQESIVKFLSRELNLAHDKIKINKNIVEYGANSISIMKLMHEFEDRYDTKITGREMLELNTIESMATHIYKKIAMLNHPASSRNLTDKLTVIEAQQKLHEFKTVKSPLSEGQKGLWMLQKTSPDMSAYNVPICFRVGRKLETDKFQQACCLLLEQYPILNTVIGEDQGVPYQTMQPAQPLFFETEDVSNLGSEEVLLYIRKKVKMPFRLEQGPLMRVHLFTHPHEGQIVLINIHHIIFDGSSFWVFVTKLLTIYQELLQEKIPEIIASSTSYNDFVEWEQEMLASKAGEEHLAYWKQQLSGTLPVLELPTDHPRTSIPNFEGQVYTRLLSSELANQIKAYANSLHIKLSVIFLGIFKVLLHRYAGQDDIIVGLPTVGRPQERFSSLIGYFINMIPIRSRIAGPKLFSEYIRELQITLVDGLDHAVYPFPILVRALNAPRIPGRAPVFQVIYLFQNFMPANILGRAHNAPDDDSNGFPIEFIEGIHQEGEYELGLEVFEQSDTFRLHFKYNPELFEAETIARMAEHYLILTSEVVKDPNIAPDSYAFLSKAETQKLLIDWNATEIDYPKEKCVHELFEEQVQKTPEAIAVIFEDETLTYRELDEKSAQLAVYLQKQGVKPDSLIGICVERHWEMVVGLLGILKAGGAYVPLDPDYPTGRLAYMLEDSKVSVLLTQARLMGKISGLLKNNLKVISLDKDWENIQAEIKTRKLNREVNCKHLAYVIYTSGSTGQPKGVMIPHRALTNFLISMSREPGLSSQDKLLAITTFCFDIAGLELYLPLINGAKVCICSSEKAKDVEKLKREIQKYRPTIMQATPVTWTMLFCTGWRNEERIKILCGGEALSETLKQSFLDNHCEVWNMFGPTETAIWSTIEFITKEKPITLGKPIANTQVYIVDRNFKPTPIGIPGELCIAGDGLANGYLNRPELTATKFVPNPFVSGAHVETHGRASLHAPPQRIYRTGDLARWTNDGKIEFLGRMDHQVKIRGFRIELGEIESQLSTHPDIHDCAVIVKEHADHKQLLAFYIARARAQKPLSYKQLRTHLSARLPEYMIPSSFIILDKMPLTPNGKHDRKALGNFPDAGQESDPLGVEPHFEIEAKVLGIWKEVLHRNDIGLEEGFFDVGGDSFLAVTVAGRINEDFNCSFSVTELFQYVNIREISKYIAGAKNVDQSVARAQITGHQRMNHIKSDNSLSYPDYYEDSIAIIGISCQFPGAKNYLEFWDNLRAGKESVKFFSKEELLSLKLPKEIVENPNFVPIQATIEDKDLFDPGFFNISPRDAEFMDPQFRLLLLHSWKAVEDAGYSPKQIPETGVFMSAGSNMYFALLSNNIKSPTEKDYSQEYVSWLLNQGGTIPTMISHKLGFQGPSFFIHSNCSSALVGVNSAVQSLRSGETKYALVGAASISSLANIGYIYEKGLIRSSDGHLKAFDASADGMIGGEGVAVIVLKRAIDAICDRDNIYAILRGIGINNDGADKVGFYAPSVKGQTAIFRKVLDATKIHPESISYIEAHGTGTELGDSIEVAALNETYRQYTIKKEYCGIGSVKTNIGHLDTASGLAGCIKVALSLYHGEIPPSLNYKEPNPNINFENSPFYVVDKLVKLDEHNIPHRAALSSFGIGGTNTHAIFEQYVSIEEPEVNKVLYIIPLSAKNEERLKVYAQEFLSFLNAAHTRANHLASEVEVQSELDLNRLAYTLQVGREIMEARLAFVVSNTRELTTKIEEYLHGNEKISGGFIGKMNQSKAQVQLLEKEEDFKEIIHKWFQKGLWGKIAEFWVNGFHIDWEILYPDPKPRRISLPTYPFARERYWFSDSKAENHPASFAHKRAVQPFRSEIGHFQTDSNELLLMNIQDYFINYISQELKLAPDKIRTNQNIGDYGASSLTIIKMLRDIENRFDIKITGREMLELKTIGSMSTYLAKKIALSGCPENIQNQAALLESLTENINDPDTEILEKFKNGTITLEEAKELI